MFFFTIFPNCLKSFEITLAAVFTNVLTAFVKISHIKFLHLVSPTDIFTVHCIITH